MTPILTPHLIYDNGACIKGKGTDFTLDRFTEYLREHIRKYGREGGIYFFDFENYFGTIPVTPLADKVGKALINERMAKTVNKFMGPPGSIGLGLGSPMSQILALFHPNPVDHYIKDTLGMRKYGRHMDDGYIIHHDIEELKEIVRQFETKCEELGIRMNRKKCRIIRLTKNFRFLKVRFFITKTGKVVRRLNQEAPKRQRDSLRAFKKFLDMGMTDMDEIKRNFNAWLYSLRFSSFYVRLNMIRFYNELFGTRYYPERVKTRKQKIMAYIAKAA